MYAHNRHTHEACSETLFPGAEVTAQERHCVCQQQRYMCFSAILVEELPKTGINPKDKINTVEISCNQL